MSSLRFLDSDPGIVLVSPAQRRMRQLGRRTHVQPPERRAGSSPQAAQDVQESMEDALQVQGPGRTVAVDTDELDLTLELGEILGQKLAQGGGIELLLTPGASADVSTSQELQQAHYLTYLVCRTSNPANVDRVAVEFSHPSSFNALVFCWEQGDKRTALPVSMSWGGGHHGLQNQVADLTPFFAPEGSQIRFVVRTNAGGGASVFCNLFAVRAPRGLPIPS